MEFLQHSPASRKEREFEQRKALILKVAESLFAEQGFSATRMEDIARLAEFGVGSLYKFFKNKEDLYSELLRQKADVIEPLVTDTMATGEGPVEKLRRYFEARIQMYWDHPQFFRLYYRDLAGGFADPTSGLTPDVQERYRRHLGHVERLFAEGIGDGLIRKASPQLLTVLSEGALRSYVQELIRRGTRIRDEEEERLVIEVFLRGIVRNGDRSR